MGSTHTIKLIVSHNLAIGVIRSHDMKLVSRKISWRRIILLSKSDKVDEISKQFDWLRELFWQAMVLNYSYVNSAENDYNVFKMWKSKYELTLLNAQTPFSFKSSFTNIKCGWQQSWKQSNVYNNNMFYNKTDALI